MPEQMRMHRLCNSCGGALLLDNLLNATGGKGGRALSQTNTDFLDWLADGFVRPDGNSWGREYSGLCCLFPRR